MKNTLVREALGEELIAVPWNECARKRYKIDEDEQAILESGKVLWRGDTAFVLEDDDEPIEIL